MIDGRVGQVLAQIATQPREEWPLHLGRAFDDDPVLRAQAMVWLLAECEGPELDGDPPSLGDEANERYELVLCLARGGTASVWQAFDRRLGRNVAIKIFQRANDRGALEQALVEARAASDVISDHVVRVLDVQHGDRHPYIVMELVCEYDADKGEVAVAATAATTPPRSRDEALRWAVQIARGVHDAHARNVFHRDLKPRNVLITPTSRRARVADFGLAVSSVTSELAHPSATILRRGPAGAVCVRGTPEYMAPEQARGLPRTLDPRDVDDRATLVAIDVWGVGALAYALLAGHPPWMARPSDDLSAWEIAASSERPRPLTHDARGAHIPRRVRRVIDKAMRPEPGERYASASAFAHDLQALLDDVPTSEDRSHLVRASLWCKRNPQLALTAVIVVVLAVLTSLTHRSVTRLRAERARIVHELDEQRHEEVKISEALKKARTGLAATSRELAAEQDNLAALETSLKEERATYRSLLATKEQALRDASQATREILEQLEAARDERRQADEARARLERAVTDTQHEAEQAAGERDRMRQEREAARTERDAAISERDEVQERLRKLRAERAECEGVLATRQIVPPFTP